MHKNENYHNYKAKASPTQLYQLIFAETEISPTQVSN